MKSFCNCSTWHSVLGGITGVRPYRWPACTEDNLTILTDWKIYCVPHSLSEADVRKPLFCWQRRKLGFLIKQRLISIYLKLLRWLRPSWCRYNLVTHVSFLFVKITLFKLVIAHCFTDLPATNCLLSCWVDLVESAVTLRAERKRGGEGRKPSPANRYHAHRDVNTKPLTQWWQASVFTCHVWL